MNPPPLAGMAQVSYTDSKGLTSGVTPFDSTNRATDRINLPLQLSLFYGGRITIGTFGMQTDIFPLGKVSGPSDQFTDIALDAQYKYTGGKHIVTAHSTWIHENQDWNASFPLGNTSNSSDFLNTLRMKSDGITLEADYLPCDMVKFSLQYTIYNKFNGGHSNYDGFRRNASDNNTLMHLFGYCFKVKIMNASARSENS